jgi:hypothetical protein
VEKTWLIPINEEALIYPLSLCVVEQDFNASLNADAIKLFRILRDFKGLFGQFMGIFNFMPPKLRYCWSRS